MYKALVDAHMVNSTDRMCRGCDFRGGLLKVKGILWASLTVRATLSVALPLYESLCIVLLVGLCFGYIVEGICHIKFGDGDEGDF